MAYNLNTIYPPELWAEESLIVLENTLVVANLVHRNFENVVAQQGDTIHTRRPSLFSVASLTNDGQSGNTLTAAAPESTNVQINLDQHKYVAFRLSDRDMATSVVNLVEQFIEPALIPIAESVDASIMSGHSTGSGEIGLCDTSVSKTTSAAAGALSVADFAKVRGKLRAQKCPIQEGRTNIVLGTTHEERALAIDSFIQANTYGEARPAMRTGYIREIFGMGVYASQTVPDDEGAASSAGDDVAQSVAFHRNAFALVTRPLESPPSDMGVRSAVVQKDGVGIRVIMTYDHQYMAWLISYDLLWGVKMLDTNLVTRLVSAAA